METAFIETACTYAFKYAILYKEAEMQRIQIVKDKHRKFVLLIDDVIFYYSDRKEDLLRIFQRLQRELLSHS